MRAGGFDDHHAAFLNRVRAVCPRIVCAHKGLAGPIPRRARSPECRYTWSMDASEPWEYRVEVVKNPELSALGDRLNRLGAQGWELVSNVSTVKTWVNLSGNDLVFVFKRRGVGPFTERPEDAPGYVVY